jgi:putative ABC transport system permease protein
MNLFALSWSYLKNKKLNTFLNILLLALGVGIIIYLLLVSHQLQEKMQANARGINLVVGAKGSPLQLILCNIYHVDFPTGNIPLALGDSYEAFRIVGTTHAYPEHYQCQLAEGQWWSRNLEVTVGSEVARQLNLRIGSTFAGSHGLSSESMHAHEDSQYTVAGIMAPSQTVLDRLILTNIASVWQVHEDHAPVSNPADTSAGDHAHDHEHDHDDDHEHASAEESPSAAGPTGGDTDPEEAFLARAAEEGREITALLIQYSSPMAAINLPRQVNSQSSLQAAAPANEIVRLFSLIGIGADVVQYFAYMIILIAGLSIFIALYNALKERQYDLAVMRTMGASRTLLFSHILLEGLLLASMGLIAGFALGHGAVELTGWLLDNRSQVSLTGFMVLPEEWMLIAGVLVVGLLASLLPALQTYRIDISRTLAG